MLKIIEKNSLFFSLYVISFFAVFFNELNKPLIHDTLYFGEHRTTIGDFFFSYWTLLGEAYPYFFVAAFFFYIKKDKQTTLKVAVTGIVILVVTYILKETFEYPRPAAVLEEMGQIDSFKFVEGIAINMGPTSFPSGHTASAFALWGLLAFQFSDSKIIQIALLLIAILVGVSRVYLTQHFPQDTLFGSAVGLSIALAVEYYFNKKKLT